MRLVLSLVALCLVLTACARPQQPSASDAQIAAVSYRDPGPAYIRLYTMINNRSGAGAHSALMVNASQRVIFDPAGSWYSENTAERNDVVYGITPRVAFAYQSAHARSTYHVVIQTVEVSPQVAEQALALVESYGAVPGSFCANATSTILSRIPGFEQIDVTMYPNRLADQFATFPGVRTEKYFEDDDPDLQKALAEYNARLRQQGG